MPLNNYKGFSLRNRVFFGILLVCLLSVFCSALLSYIVFRNNSIEQNNTEIQNKVLALMSSLDYAVSQTQVQTKDLPQVLGNKIYEIADINKHDIVIYDLQGNAILSNNDKLMLSDKKIPKEILPHIKQNESRYDVLSYDKKVGGIVTSSYFILKNNTLDPIAIVYFQYYHNDSGYLGVFSNYLKYIAIANFFIILFGIWLSWIISNNLTNAITKFSEKITRITLFEKEFRPIKYYQNDELNALVNAYNKMILKIQDQKERLTFKEKEEAWREMAKQVAHEVKNPLTPMKLTIQDFERKFDANDPKVDQKVKQMSESMVDYIDLIATVASAFSQFAKLPEKNNETINLNHEIKNILGVFNDNTIFSHFSKTDIMMNIDRIYLSRIITNLVTNAQQAKSEERDSIINVDVEQTQKRVTIVVEDNGTGISPDKLEKIFEPNFTSKNSGMGLGLTMVRKMIEDYQGGISVKSTLGKGTKFTITLPTNL